MNAFDNYYLDLVSKKAIVFFENCVKLLVEMTSISDIIEISHPCPVRLFLSLKYITDRSFIKTQTFTSSSCAEYNGQNMRHIDLFIS